MMNGNLQSEPAMHNCDPAGAPKECMMKTAAGPMECCTNKTVQFEMEPLNKEALF